MRRAREDGRLPGAGLLPALCLPLLLTACQRDREMADRAEMPDSMPVVRALADPEVADSMLDTMPAGEMARGDSAAAARLLRAKMPSDGCAELARVLRAVPHDSLSRSAGMFTSVRDGRMREGCEVRFAASDAALAGAGVPDLSAAPGTILHGLGWRPVDALAADGAGTGLHGVRREGTLCVISRSRPAFVDEAGEPVESDTLRVTVQCRDADAGTDMGGTGNG